MAVTKVKEAQMEKTLIDHLTKEANQWRLREDLKTIPQLWANFFQILEDNNRDQLHDVPLTQNEKETIRTQITKPNFYQAAKFLAGANRQVRHHLKRDDSSLPDADLLILDNTNIAGGTSVYEVVHQVEVNKSSLSPLDQDRRFDVTLLINGLPLIHIELKTPNFPFMDAFRQIQKYIDEDKFGDIYNFVEMFVVTNGTNTQYIAAGQNLRPNFLISWIDHDRQQVNNYLDFAHEVLSIPMAHHMIADYTVLDDNAQRIILLRPYQIQAIQAIFKESRKGKSGFIWHATGSGKTLTSYKVARNLLQIPAIDKTIFLIDRKDLDMQTVTAFQTYANNDTIDVDETANSFELARQLGDGNRNVIVTTRQKLQTIFKRMESSTEIAKKYEKLKDLRLAFIVDECHRAVTPAQKRELDRFFNRQPLWYGFTGTPIFAENARSENGQDARTTEQLYGPILHKYTIEDAIHDKKVLGFKIDNEGSSNQTDNDQIYLADAHMKAVVKQVLALAYRKQGLSNGHRYSALFSTSSIKQAQKYYHLFKEAIVHGEVPNRIQKVAPDFPRIAITYSISQNEEESIANQAEMKQALDDYNKMFNTHFSMSELGSYNRNVNDRLACKNKMYQTRDQQLDIVIVVDRLLTGFDAPKLSTLYLDRPPMNAQNLIQAFSRTNRIYDDGKKWGQIVTFQYPDQYSEAIDNALTLYANGGSDGVLAPDWNTSRQRYVQARKKLDKYVNNPQILDTIIDAPKKDQKEFIKAFQKYDQALAAIKTYDELDKQDKLPVSEQININDISPEIESTLEGVYQNVIAALKADNKNEGDPVDLDIDEDYELESIHIKEVDEHYIMSLIQDYISTANQQVSASQKSEDQNETTQVVDYIDQYAKTNESRANQIRSIWQDVQDNPQKYMDQKVEDVLANSIKQKNEKILGELADDFGLDYDNLNYVVNNFKPDEANPKGMGDLVSKRYFDRYKENHPDSKWKNWLSWKTEVREKVKVIYNTKIKPLESED
ncbi:type I restriction enzyme, R subunit [Lactobacillus apis]|uniref:type I restriction endonuclease subunit R, EcoR124 family n=1 Tax=Lactobacillus apis TaxID=303541 RepID=UPI000815F1B6|nr:DEAD/DEAH box helicase family protein [Lactobacillus apis]GGG35113.1 restriction endonuclease subunit R [Lactobacillus apis]SCB84322.1 type I restriction enzyme, R subunit [Lactobacillus apis]